MTDRFIDHEEFFHQKKDKRERQERKRLSEKDRSQYKKTDLDKIKKADLPDEGKEGRVVAILADGILVQGIDQNIYTCNLKGVLKKKATRIKNAIAVGDRVSIIVQSKSEGSIQAVYPRTTILSRATSLNRRKEQLIAANVDQVFITVSIVQPKLKTSLIDRYLIAVLKEKMKPVIVINKIDLLATLEAEEVTQFEAIVSLYRSLGFVVLTLSATCGTGIDLLIEQAASVVSVFSGQSGTGKSSLINLLTGSNLATGAIVAKTGKGSHTTTSTQMLPTSAGGFCIDTPGIKSFAIWGMTEQDLRCYFPEIDQAACMCRYTNCTHRSEPHCAVREAVALGTISPLRFDSYLVLMKELHEEHRLR